MRRTWPIAVEIVGGLLILFGAFVPLAAAPMIIVLLVAIFTVHLPNGFRSIKLMSYDVPLRRDLVVRLTLPVDLTDADARRLANFVNALAFSGAPW